MYMCIFITFLCIIIVYYSSASIHLVTSTTGFPTVISTSGITDAESNTIVNYSYQFECYYTSFSNSHYYSGDHHINIVFKNPQNIR